MGDAPRRAAWAAAAAIVLGAIALGGAATLFLRVSATRHAPPIQRVAGEGGAAPGASVMESLDRGIGTFFGLVDAEPRDPVWAPGRERELREAWGDAARAQGANLSVECRTTACRMIVDVGPELKARLNARAAAGRVGLAFEELVKQVGPPGSAWAHDADLLGPLERLGALGRWIRFVRGRISTREEMVVAFDERNLPLGSYSGWLADRRRDQGD